MFSKFNLIHGHLSLMCNLLKSHVSKISLMQGLGLNAKKKDLFLQNISQPIVRASS